MSPEATRDLSIRDLLRALNEKLNLEWVQVRDTPTSSPNPAVSLEPELESLETTAHNVLRFIHSLRNPLRPVNRLPPEIISRIAGCLLDKHAPGTGSILPLTHVCQYWRESITSAPENWTLISSCQMGLMKLNLERSKAAPLHLRFNSYSFDPFWFCELITPHIQNIQTLRLDEYITVEDLAQALPNFPQSTPNLRFLELAHKDGEPRWNPSIDPFESFPDTLRALTLYDIPLYPSILKLTTLTELNLHYYHIRPTQDTLLRFLEENRSLESVHLRIDFDKFPVRVSQRQAGITNRIQYLSITFWNPVIAQTLISSIPLQRGAHLEITYRDEGTELGLSAILSNTSITHLPNLLSPTFIEYRSSPRVIRLVGPNGRFSYNRDWSPRIPFTEFLVLPLTDVRELFLIHSDLSMAFLPSPFPTLETLAIECNDASCLSSVFFPNHSAFPSLKTLEFSGCVITEEFMEELAQFAVNRKASTLTWLHRVVIVDQDGGFPTAASISKLEEHVPIVDVRFDTMFRRSV